MILTLTRVSPMVKMVQRIFRVGRCLGREKDPKCGAIQMSYTT
jgi:hypothetical protein